MMTWKGQKFERINFGLHNMHGWIICDKNGNVRGAISNASHEDVAKFRELKATVANYNNVEFESILPVGWNSYPDLRSAVA